MLVKCSAPDSFQDASYSLLDAPVHDGRARRRGRGSVGQIDCARCGRSVTSEAPRRPDCGADPRTGIATFKRGEMDRVRVCQGVWIRCLAIFLDFLVVTAVVSASADRLPGAVGGGSFAEVGKEPSSWPLWLAAFIGAFIYFLAVRGRSGEGRSVSASATCAWCTATAPS